jgi:hypothetical protein
VAQALAAEDAAALAPHLDAPAIRAALGTGLDPSSRLGGQAEAYLGGMAAEIQAGLGHPAAIAEMLLARGARGAGWPVPDSPTRYAMTLTGGREAILLRLELGEGLRWRVTRVVLGQAR